MHSLSFRNRISAPQGFEESNTVMVSSRSLMQRSVTMSPSTSTAMVRHSAIIFFMKKSLRLSFFSVFVPYPCSDSLDVIEFSI